MQLLTVVLSFTTSTKQQTFFFCVPDVLICWAKHNLKIQTFLLQDKSASMPDMIKYDNCHNTDC